MMSAACPNPCATCSIKQDCCTHLSGLRVTEIEFQRCFAKHAETLHIEREGPIFVLTPRDGAACPHWQNGRCAVYDVRPRECQLFPYTLFVRKQEDDLVSMGYHSDTRCPAKESLLVTEMEAREIAASFAQEAFPNSSVEVRRETTPERLWRHTVETAWEILLRVKAKLRRPRETCHASKGELTSL